MTSKTDDPNIDRAPSPRLWFALVFIHLFIPLILLVCGGDPSWWQAWIFGVLLFVAGTGGRFLAEKRHPGILVERADSEKTMNAKPWDKVLSPLMAISLTFPLVIVAGLDHRYGWTPLFSTSIHTFGLVLVALGYAFATWALIENRFFSSTVHIQTDRGHSVCDSGPYRIVRHPGYAGNLLALPGIIMALNSMWTLIPALAALAIAVLRTALEDKTLHEELQGYRDYAQRVRYRLIPWIY
ncbi:isoprenylcysteine carboxylmethyltransferase family protein [Sulfurovum sp. XGS-02]|uniref:methyltransferase family protein n=1 Tax=Sulfurovum sp. XGS-02 TaxID=2925411 RepID=UPI002046F1FE|nr:isoprenylcysteine carboxylmethyltransferase family protein [Sulfurovum sp. XGS-02]UPT78594.1 isoprenylcysteine carboxylmethyltransferase family protein [Sulfurovum sp. XGS-02]